MTFKFKLVAYFVLLTLVPLTAVFVGFRGVVEERERRLVDERLRAGVRAAAVAYDDELDAAAVEAGSRVRRPAFALALARRDRRALARLLGSRNMRVEAGAFRAGRAIAPAAERRVAVLTGRPRRRVATVIVSIPLDAALAARLTRRSGLDPGEGIVVVDRRRVVGAPRRLVGARVRLAGGVGTVTLAGRRYRIVAVPVRRAPRTVLVAVSPQRRIDDATLSAGRLLLLAFLATLLFVAAVAWLQGRSIVRVVRELVAAANALAHGRLSERVTVRGRDELAVLARAFNEMADQLEARLREVEAERRRVRETTRRFGDALAATHSVDGLLHAIVETAVDGTAARGGALVRERTEVISAGRLDAADDRIELPLVAGPIDFGTLVLAGDGFTAEDVETTVLLVSHAVVALENARLHGIVQRQARIDPVTGLANRRRAEEALAVELARAARFGGPVALVLADIDGFKAVNDRYGHHTGDRVLRALGEIMRATVREVDLPARWGGEEFVLVLPETDAAGAGVVADRVRRALARQPVSVAGGAIAVTASFGVAAAPPASSRDELVAAADAALYQAKRAGKNRVAVAPDTASRP